jgi:hypothetical protein
MKNKQTQIQWLQNEIKKDGEELEKEKLNFVNELKKLKKEDIIPKPQKQSTWEKIKKILNNF